MSGIRAKLQEEFMAVLPPTLYFFVALHIVAFIRMLMIKETGITVTASASLTLAALLLGKSVLLADMLPFINLYPQRPLIYNIAWKSLIYLLMAAGIHYLERLVEFARQTGSIAAGNERLLAEMVWPHFFALQIVLSILILLYCTMHELARVLGGDEMRRIFFGPVTRRLRIDGRQD
jgi:hypothetical protein